MRNLRIEGEYFVYDCNGQNCPTPGEPHRVHRNDVLAGVDCVMRELVAAHDMRSESLDVALQWLYQTLYKSARADVERPWGTKSPWHEELLDLGEALDALDAEMEAEAEVVTPRRVEKQYMN